MPSDPRLERLEEIIAHLEHHVAEQDRVILALSDDLSRLRKTLGTLQDHLAHTRETDAPVPPPTERPPHYGTGR
jgi:uncharacterized coiled-coil protein SlyX